MAKYDYNQKLIELGITTVPIEPFINYKTKIKHKCIVGHELLVSPNSLIGSKYSCKECYRLSKIKSEELHRKEIYPCTFTGTYVNTTSKLVYTCPDGHTWESTPNSMLSKKYVGCSFCKSNERTELNKEAYLLKLDSLAIELLDPYVNSITHMRHRCKAKGHSIVTTAANLIHEAKGCIYCKYEGPGTLYYIKVEGPDSKTYYKIGITTGIIEKRLKSIFCNYGYKYRLLFSEEYTNINEAGYAEQKILLENAAYRLKVDFVYSGFTEFFSKDVLGLDK